MSIDRGNIDVLENVGDGASIHFNDRHGVGCSRAQRIAMTVHQLHKLDSKDEKHRIEGSSCHLHCELYWTLRFRDGYICTFARSCRISVGLEAMAAPPALKQKCVAPPGAEITSAGANAGMSMIMSPAARSMEAVKGAANAFARLMFLLNWNPSSIEDYQAHIFS